MLMNVLFSFIILVGTALCGLPFVPGKRYSSTGALALSFSIGYAIISLAGLLASIFKFGVFPLQLVAMSLSLLYLMMTLRHTKRGDMIWCLQRSIRKEGRAFVFICYYLTLLLFLFGMIPTWMAGDTVERARTIRMYLDGLDVPVSVFPFGSYWDYYPKAFQVYAFFWMRMLPVGLIEILKVIPVLMTAVTSLLIYSLVLAFYDREIALYTIVLTGLCFIPHYATLIWGGFTSVTGELLMMAVLVTYSVDRRLLPLLFTSLLFTHPRFVIYTSLVLGGWRITDLLKNRNLFPLATKLATAFFIGLIFVIFYNHNPSNPGYFARILTERETLTKFVGMWYLSVPALLSLRFIYQRRDALDTLVLSWTAIFILFALAADGGIIPSHRNATDRILLNIHIPIGIVGAITLQLLRKWLERAYTVRIVRGALLVLLLLGSSTVSLLFYWYALVWGLPEPDYDAMLWLNEQNYSDSIAVSLDATGLWIYPLTGIPVYDFDNISFKPSDAIWRLSVTPNHRDALSFLDELRSNHRHVLVYISNVSMSRPGYRPPFLRFYGYYLTVDPISFGSEYYQTIYNGDGTYILEYSGQNCTNLSS